MDNYKLSINLIKKASTENHPIILNICCDDIEEYCSSLCTKGFIADDKYGCRFIPSHRIEDIDIEDLSSDDAID
jgi:hypothetical protein